jgi:hypothetical protein
MFVGRLAESLRIVSMRCVGNEINEGFAGVTGLPNPME